MRGLLHHAHTYKIFSFHFWKRCPTQQASRQEAILVWRPRPGPVSNVWSPGCRHKSKQALRDYQKVLVQLENLEISVGDQCRKEFTGVGERWKGDSGEVGGKRAHPDLSSHLGASWPADLMTEMTDLSSDLEGSGIPFLDYHTYAERVFFPGHGGCPLQPTFEGPGEEGHRAPVRQGLTQLSNLLNSKLFLLTVRVTWAGRGSWEARKWGWVAGMGTKVGRPTEHRASQSDRHPPPHPNPCPPSSSTHWRSSPASPSGTAATWLHCCLWHCTASLST